jgi:transposase
MSKTTSRPVPLTTEVPPAPSVCLGLDIAKLKLDACLLQAAQSNSRQFDNTPSGLSALRAWCLHLGQPSPFTVLEATGAYGELAASTLHASGFPLHLAHARRVKEFARSLGRRNKTDRLDAQTIAQFGRSRPWDPRPLPLWEPPTAELQTLRTLMRRHADLQTMVQAEANRAETAGSCLLAVQSLARVRKALTKELVQLESLLRAHLQAHPALQADIDRLCEIEGIGFRSACWLCAELPRHLPHPRAAAAWLGVTPRLRQSGSSLHATAPTGSDGNRRLRKVLFMAAMSARRHNPRLRTFADRLAANGKPKLSVILAVMHKLLKISFALLKNQSSYLPLHHPLPSDPQPPK